MWLRQQREKQRIIWAYKTLFLDVLFPMDLDKVIPQWATITRIWGASGSGRQDIGNSSCEAVPIISGYTRFCFLELLIDWPCSALHVVDLIQFRQMAAGVR
jgi:UDP-glucose:glycoprotein glucosyltransferase